MESSREMLGVMGDRLAELQGDDEQEMGCWGKPNGFRSKLLASRWRDVRLARWW